MLYSPYSNHFNWSADNVSGNYLADVSFGTVLTASTTANTKGVDTALLSGVAHDVYGIQILFGQGFTDATIRRQMTDILIDPAAGVGNAGSSWSVLIDNLYTNGPGTSTGGQGHNFYFPIFLPAGTAIGARMQDLTGASATVRCSIRVVGQPSHPEVLRVGSVVQTIGATTASTSGVAVTPGTDAYGSYSASMGTLTRPAWWWQLGIGSNDTTMTANFYVFDIATDATSKYIAARDIKYGVTTTTGEVSWKSSQGEEAPVFHAPAGTDVYVRGCGLGAPDGTITTVVYAVT